MATATKTHKVYLHDGRVLWPEHKPLEEVLEIRETTPEPIWYGTYQGQPTRPGGHTFRASWWQGKNRYDSGDDRLSRRAYARYMSWDTAQKDNPENDTDYSAYIVAELWPDYRLAVRYCQAERLEFPELPETMEAEAARWNRDDKLRAVIIEDKVSGTSALQTLRATSPAWLRSMLVPFMPSTDKVTRAGQAAVWCKNGCVLLPYPEADLYWLPDLEDQLFEFPKAAHDDMVDALSQLLLYLEHFLEQGYRARKKEAQA